MEEKSIDCLTWEGMMKTNIMMARQVLLVLQLMQSKYSVPKCTLLLQVAGAVAISSAETCRCSRERTVKLKFWRLHSLISQISARACPHCDPIVICDSLHIGRWQQQHQHQHQTVHHLAM